MVNLKPHTPIDPKTLQIISQLSPYFVSGTDQILFLNAMLGNWDNESLNITLNWLVQRNDIDFLTFFKAFYQIDVPDRIQIYVALAKNDLPVLQSILSKWDVSWPHSNDTWPRSDYINAAVRLENTPLAETLAISELTERPLAQEIYQEFTQYAVADANNVKLTQEYQKFINLVGPRTKFETKQNITKEWSIIPYISIWDVKTNDSTVLTNVPAQDFQTGLKLNQKIHRGSITYQAGYRDALNSFAPVSVDLNYQLSARWHADIYAGINQDIYQTAYLLIGGVQDRIGAHLINNIAKYDDIQIELQGYNYYSQDRHYLADGLYLQGLFEHKFWLQYPDTTLGIYGNIYAFSRNGSFGGDITRLFPPITSQQQAIPGLAASIQQADYQQLVPPSYGEGGFIFSFGNAILDYTHAWCPYVWVSLAYNTYVGLVNQEKIGLNGSVFGRDSLLLYAEHGTAPGVKNSVTNLLGLRYALYY